MKLFLSAFITLFFASTILAQDQKIQAYNAEALMKRVKNQDTLYVVNFWATWCMPCVQELPIFEKLNAQGLTMDSLPIKVLMVSMDFKEDIAFRVPTFLERKKMKAEVVWLSDTKPNDFIPKIDNRWEGSIPMTLITYKGCQNKIEQTLDDAALLNYIEKTIKKCSDN